MKTLHIHFVDFWDKFKKDDNIFTKILKKNNTLVYDSNNPEYLFYSCFGMEHMQYPNAIKICYLAENITPDFNIADYAVAFDQLSFGERYFRFPLYRLYMSDSDFYQHDAVFWQQEQKLKTKFCNFLYTNSNRADNSREQFFDILSEYKKVDSGGGCRNNIGYRVGDKQAWQKQYKFSIAFENSFKRGYTTEKIYQALQAHTIPIYWGNPDIGQEFNEKRFINCHKFSSFQKVADYIRELDRDDERYLAMLSEPWFTHGMPPRPEQDISFTTFLQNIIEQPLAEAKRTTQYGYTRAYYDGLLLQKKIMPLQKILQKIQNAKDKFCR